MSDPAPPPAPIVGTFPKDGLPYEIHALGGVTLTGQNRGIDVFLVRAGSTPTWENREKDFEPCVAPLSEVTALEVGSVWLDQKLVAYRSSTPQRRRLWLRHVRVEDSKGLACPNKDLPEAIRVFRDCHRLPPPVYARGWSALAKAKVDEKDEFVVFPCPVIFLSCYGATSTLVIRLFRPLPTTEGQWERALWLDKDADGTERSYIDPFTGKMRLCLSAGVDYVSGPYVAQFRQDHVARERAKRVTEFLWKSGRGAHLRAELPFAKPCDVEVIATQSDAGLMVHRIIRSSYALPGVSALEYAQERDSSSAPNQGGVQPRLKTVPQKEATDLEDKELRPELSARADQKRATWLVPGVEWPFHSIPVTRHKKESTKHERKPPPRKDDSEDNLVAGGEGTHEQAAVPGVTAQRSDSPEITANFLEQIAAKPGFAFIADALAEMAARAWSVTRIQDAQGRLFFGKDGRSDNDFNKPRLLGISLRWGTMRALLFEGPTFFAPFNPHSPLETTGAVLCKRPDENADLDEIVSAIYKTKSDLGKASNWTPRSVKHRWDQSFFEENELHYQYYAKHLAAVIKKMSRQV